MEKSASFYKRGTVFLFAAAILVWVYCFWGHLTAHYTLESDANSYYDHINFYITSLAKGVFPLWDPYLNDYGGGSNEFFLRRFGAFNPLYLLMAFMVKLGMTPRLVYTWSMAGYYMLGMVGFYALAMRIYKHQLAAFTGTLVLMFSALGTRIFDSYMVIIAVPSIWFFYFAVVFGQQRLLWAFLGMTLTAGILLTTYIPLYFALFLFIVSGVFLLVYARDAGPLLSNTMGFLWRHKKWCATSALFLVLAVLPSVVFMKSAASGNVVMPVRHGDVATNNQLTVDYQLAAEWGIPEDLLYSSYFFNLKRLRFAVLYVPLMGFLVLGLGALTRIRRETLFVFLSIFFMLCVVVPNFLPIHGKLYQTVSFFKYFRNLHFFLWFFLVPLFALFVVDQFYGVMKSIEEKRLKLNWVYLVHAAALALLFINQDDNWSNYLTVIVSAVLFRAFVLRPAAYGKYAAVLLAGCIMLQPLEAYHHFALHAMRLRSNYTYENYSAGKFIFKKEGLLDFEESKAGLYVAPYWYNVFYNATDVKLFNAYTQHRLSVYEQERSFDTPDPLKSNVPVAYVEKNTDQFKVTSFGPNQLTAVSNFPQDEFLVYSDSYDPQWRVFIDGHPGTLKRANMAFKGVWLPSGRHEVRFVYGNPWYYAFNVGLVVLFALLLLTVIRMRWCNLRGKLCP